MLLVRSSPRGSSHIIVSISETNQSKVRPLMALPNFTIVRSTWACIRTIGYNKAKSSTDLEAPGPLVFLTNGFAKWFSAVHSSVDCGNRVMNRHGGSSAYQSRTQKMSSCLAAIANGVLVPFEWPRISAKRVGKHPCSETRNPTPTYFPLKARYVARKNWSKRILRK